MNTNELREEFYKDFDYWELHIDDSRTRREFAADWWLKKISLALAKRDEEEREAVDKMLQFILESIPADENSLNTRYGIREIKAINNERYNQRALIRSLLNNKDHE